MSNQLQLDEISEFALLDLQMNLLIFRAIVIQIPSVLQELANCQKNPHKVNKLEGVLFVNISRQGIFNFSASKSYSCRLMLAN
jgi:hypothetical protein